MNIVSVSLLFVISASLNVFWNRELALSLGRCKSVLLALSHFAPLSTLPAKLYQAKVCQPLRSVDWSPARIGVLFLGSDVQA